MSNIYPGALIWEQCCNQAIQEIYFVKVSTIKECSSPSAMEYWVPKKREVWAAIHSISSNHNSPSLLCVSQKYRVRSMPFVARWRICLHFQSKRSETRLSIMSFWKYTMHSMPEQVEANVELDDDILMKDKLLGFLNLKSICPSTFWR